LILARSLGISYKRLNGWEPETVYTYDGARLVSSRPESEWDEEQVAWFLHLAEWEDGRCPSCGMQKSVCQDPMAEWNIDVPAPTRCHVTTAVKRAQKGYAKSEIPEALLFGARMRD
jgi:hypothetical protein